MTTVKTNELNELLWKFCDDAGLDKTKFKIDCSRDGCAVLSTIDGSLPFGAKRYKHDELKAALEFAPGLVRHIKGVA